MTAQQQLAELIRKNGEGAPFSYFSSWKFLFDHGPAIAELIEEAQCASSSLSGQEYRRFTAAIAKLTEPK